MNSSARERFLSYVRDPHAAAQVVSPFLPHPDVVRSTLAWCGLHPTGDPVADEIALSRHLGYQPMFMTECSSLIFNWQIDESRSTAELCTRVIATPGGEWAYCAPRRDVPWSDESPLPVQGEADHRKLVEVCRQIAGRESTLRAYFREWRRRVGEEGVIVLGHPHPSWLGYQINPSNIFFSWNDSHDLFVRSMEAISEASLYVMSIALEEGIDFMSDSSYGLEMTSPALFAAMDLPYIQRFAAWTHDHGGLFWYHNCGYTSRLIREGVFNTLGADLIETIAPPPEGDNDLAESRRAIDRRICTKGNLNLRLLRDGTPAEIAAGVRAMAGEVRGAAHVLSTADAVLQGTPPENFAAFVASAREAAGW
ncbi:MAG TPA: uroporphyrinogen decarboxylase family protein [Bacteroidota bacterium]|nr:uroporphyrinogen decarboxylase family protein [Bacteroidota bacterium]